MTDLSSPKQRLLDWIEDYIDWHHYVPSREEMAFAMGYASKDTVQVHLKDLRNAGYVDWETGRARSLKIRRPRSRKIPVLGVIAASGLVETFPQETIEEFIDASTLTYFAGKSRHQMASYFALRVRGDSMIGAAIADGDTVILRQELEPRTIKNGEIVAARCQTQTTLKYLFWSDRKVILQPANSSYPVIEKNADEVDIDGVFVGLIRKLA
ncbi:MAG: repressor LexA [Candidatus Parcubacteria bacterium]|uniref:transcriptional repressor LexA n=1 Tax=Phormidesmis priestleyi TaxID=268141 RepID=UPI000839DAE8|nr:transcriptional repressor LexA [Phormidesmis priestleyi]MBC7823031.1 repressor LexA [Leptolyngbyaceae cyanobacterium LF-bin-113]